MPVWIDDMHKYPMGQFGRMKMSHMVSDNEAELHAFAASIGLKRSWFQGDHYDVSLGCRAKAVAQGAVEITLKQCALMMAVFRRTGVMPPPEHAEAVRLALSSRPRGGK